MLDLDYHHVDMSPESLYDICQALSEQGPERVVITGLQQGERIFNYVYEKNNCIASRSLAEDSLPQGGVFVNFCSISPPCAFASFFVNCDCPQAV